MGEYPIAKVLRTEGSAGNRAALRALPNPLHATPHKIGTLDKVGTSILATFWPFETPAAGVICLLSHIACGIFGCRGEGGGG